MACRATAVGPVWLTPVQPHCSCRDFKLGHECIACMLVCVDVDEFY